MTSSVAWRRWLRPVLAGSVLLLSAHAQAQNFNRPFVHSGTTLGLLRIQNRYDVPPTYRDAPAARRTIFLLGMNLGLDQALVRISDEQSVGVGLNFSMVLVCNFHLDENGIATPALVSLPEYVTWRYGARATRQSSSIYGVGVGLGYRFGTLLVPRYSAPSAMIELTSSSGAGHSAFVRLSTDLRSVTYNDLPSNRASQTRLHNYMLTLGIDL